MAMWSTTGCMPHCRELMPKLKPTIVMPYCLAPCSKTTPYNLRFAVRSTDEAATTATEETWEGVESDAVEEVAKGPPSLISALNVEKAFRGIAITDVDHYGRLGLRRGSSYELVRAAYQSKATELASQGLDDEKLNQELDCLKESYRILSTEEERRLYDWSLARAGTPDRYAWPFEVDITQVSVKGTPPAQEPENVGPTVAVGYFFLGWVVLACVLSVILNQR